MVGLIDAPAELVEAVAQRSKEIQRAGDALEIVAGFVQLIDAMRVPASDRAVGVLHDQEELGLDADVEDIPLLSGLVQHSLEIDARAITDEAGRRRKDPRRTGRLPAR